MKNHDQDCDGIPQWIAIGIAPRGIVAIGIVPMGVITVGAVGMGIINISLGGKLSADDIADVAAYVESQSSKGWA